AHRAFLDAVNRARPAQQLWWERRLQTAERGGEVAASIFALKNIAPQDWREVRSVEHSHRLASTLTDAELRAIAAGNMSGQGITIDAEYQNISERANER